MAAAQDICGPALAACDLQDDAACLEKTFACGEYDTVIRTLFAEDIAPTNDQKYFVGASFFGKQIRERSAGLRCEMIKQAREYLGDYLSASELAFGETGSFGTVRQMDQLYHATQMMEELGEAGTCPDSALTRATIQTVARVEATRYAKDVFLAPPDEARAAFDTLVLSLRSFVSRASDLETGIALRRVEIDAADFQLAGIRTDMMEFFGQVTGAGANLAVDTSVLDALEVSTARMLRETEVHEEEFREALGGVSVEEYADIRADTVADANDFLKESALHINMIGVLLPTDPTRSFWRLDAAVNAPGAGKQAFDDLAQIHADWSAFGQASQFCAIPGAADRLWYCR